MKIAVASRDGVSVAGHIGKCKEWIIFEASKPADVKLRATEKNEPFHKGQLQLNWVKRVTLPKAFVFHYYKDDAPHPLADCDALIGASAGESFISKMARRGIKAVLTAERDPEKAVGDFLNQQLTPPRPRPVGGLICKLKDSLSSSR